MQEERISKDEAYMQMAEVWAKRSYCVRKKVGALIVKDGQIISDGFNGTPSGFDNCCEIDENTTNPIVLHAESNAILKIACSTQSSVGSTLYQTMSPCGECAKLIIQAKIVRVVFRELYRDASGIEILRSVGIEVEQI
jgi:dCMP deaminase